MKRINTTDRLRMDLIRFYSEQWQLPVLPIYANKRPSLREWNKYKERLPTPIELDEWFIKKTAWGITLILKNKLFCVDFDTPYGYELLKDKFPAGSCIAKTPHGYHVLMKSSTIIPVTIRGNNPQWLSCLERLNPKLVEIRKDDRKQGKIDFLGNNSLLHSPDSPGYTWLELYEEPSAVPFKEWMEDVFGYTVPLPRLTDFVKLGATTTPRWVNEYCPWCEADGLTHDSPSCQVDVEGGGFKCHGSCGRTGKLTEFVAKAQEAGMPLKHEAEIMEAYKRFSTLEEKPMQRSFIIPTDEQFVFRGDELVKIEQMAEPIVPGVMFRGDIVEDYGQAGTGKTSYQTAAAADFIAARALYGTWEIPHAYKVFYLDLENSQGETRLAIQAAVDNDTEALRRVTIAEMTGLGFDITNDNWYAWLDEQLSQGYDVAIGDNLGKMTGRNIIDDNEMKTVVNQYLRPLVRKHNILFILIHHTGWERYDAQGRQLPSHGKGGSSLFEDVNACFEIKKQSKYVSRLTVKKIRSRQATIATGDEFVYYYDKRTMRILPVMWKAVFDKLEYLTGKLGLGVAADRLNTTNVNISRYKHGYRQPSAEMIARIDKLAKEEGFVGRFIA